VIGDTEGAEFMIESMNLLYREGDTKFKYYYHIQLQDGSNHLVVFIHHDTGGGVLVLDLTAKLRQEIYDAFMQEAIPRLPFSVIRYYKKLLSWSSVDAENS
jgi:hypothetical protein